MNSKLHNKLVFTALGFLFLGAQAVSAQNPYQGIPYENDFFPTVEALEIGTAVGAEDKVQLEYFDTMTYNDGSPDNKNGANIGNFKPEEGVAGTYFDKNSAGDEPSSEERSAFRAGSGVDIVERGIPGNITATVITANQGQEYQFYTVNVLTSGVYTLKLHYSHTSPNPKRFQVFVHPDPNDIETWDVIFNSSVSGSNPPNMPATYNIDEDEPPYAYGDSEETTPFELTAGKTIIRARTLDAGWQTDYMTFTLQETLSTDDVTLENSLKVYPNPASNGRFQMNIESEWDVYSLLGAKVLEGKGKNIDLSGVAKGTYILKTETETKKLIFN
jgi:hypothetical protein